MENISAGIKCYTSVVVPSRMNGFKVNICVICTFIFQGLQRLSSRTEAALPCVSISSPGQREAIKNIIAMPLAQKSCVAVAFRIIWKQNEEVLWRSIVPQRLMCDQYLNNMDGISMIISAITGTLGKAADPGGMRRAYPGISYWIVLQSPDVDPRAIVRQVQQSLQLQAEVKLLQEPPLLYTVSDMHSTLCKVMKDHSNKFIKRKIAESDPENTPEGNKGPATRIVAVNSDFVAFATAAQLTFAQEGMSVDAVQY